MLTIETTLAIFLMLGIASLAVFWAKLLHVPHTVFLVIIGAGLGLLSGLEPFSFFNEFKLTPELLFYLLLPTLIFESAYNMSIRKLMADAAAVLSLSIGSFLVSTVIISLALHWSLGFLGLDVPFMITLLFGSLISATDPVAVLALFKEYGVPRRLSLIFEGESLFNDATAVALFLVTLEAVNNHSISIFTSITGLLTFSSMLINGLLFGLLVGGIFAFLIGSARENEVASITLTIVLAHVTFIMAELVSTITFFDSFTIPLSPIISTTVASLLIGNYGRTKIHPEAEEFVKKIWEQFAFMANSLIFILIGILIIETPFLDPIIVTATMFSVIVVATARALSIYPVVGIYNIFQNTKNRIPMTWQHLLAWGSLRGALAVTMVFLIPDDLVVPGWNLAASPKEFLLSLTIGCIAATLFIKALTIKNLVRYFKIDNLTAIEEVEYQEARALMHHKVTNQLEKYVERGYIDSEIANALLDEHNNAFTTACEKVCALSEEHRNDLAFRVLRIYAIGIERRSLKNLLEHSEVTEDVFRRIWGKLQIQLEAIEHGNLSPDVTLHDDGRDVFERLAGYIHKITRPKSAQQEATDRYMYYRAQVIISRKVIKELSETKIAKTIFTDEAVKHVLDLYTNFKISAQAKLNTLANEHPKWSGALAVTLAQHSVQTIETTVLNDIYKKELITPKLFIALKEEIKKVK